MGEGNFGIGFALIILSPLIALGVVTLIGVLIIARARTGKGRMAGIAILVVVILSVGLPPLINALQQQHSIRQMRALSTLPETIHMQNATVLVFGMQQVDCGALCEGLLAQGYARQLWYAHQPYPPQPDIFHPGPTDLTKRQGLPHDDDTPQPTYLRDLTQLPDSIDYVLFNATHWLRYHDKDVVLDFPDGAYQGRFLYRVTDARAFDISKAEQLAALYQAGFTAPRFLWFSQAVNDNYGPKNSAVAKLLLKAICKGRTAAITGADCRQD